MQLHRNLFTSIAERDQNGARRVTELLLAEAHEDTAAALG
jgi:DNA-binding FadR family transcriptional regulator